MKSPKYNYPKIQSSWKEPYQTPITVSLPKWSEWVANGYNTLYDGAIVPNPVGMNGAVYMGHVRQNPMTANYY